MPESPPFDPAPTLATVEKLLAKKFGGPVRLALQDILREQSRNRVFRVRVEAGALPGVPATVIIKTSEGSAEQPYNPAIDTKEAPAWRLYNEWASNAFLDSLQAEIPLGAGLLGGDAASGLIILQDLGADGESLADCVQAIDRVKAEAALLSYAASLGRLHALTTGHEAEFRRLRHRFGGAEVTRLREGADLLVNALPMFRAFCEEVGVKLPDGVEQEAQSIQETLAEPGQFLAFTPGDTCPDNHRLTNGAYVRFFDFEFANFKHAFLDAAYFYLPFPTCWCVNRLPGTIVSRMETAYRAELAVGCPAATDDAVFYPALLAARAYWTLKTLTPGWGKGLDEDTRWGISTIWQRHLLRLENFAEASVTYRALPFLGAIARELADRLRIRFALEEEMPLYPPFRTEEN